MRAGKQTREGKKTKFGRKVRSIRGTERISEAPESTGGAMAETVLPWREGGVVASNLGAKWDGAVTSHQADRATVEDDRERSSSTGKTD